MPKERLQVDGQIPAPALRPAAAPVDTFTQTGAGTALSQLAAGLSSLAPNLARFTDVYGDVYKNDQTAQGVAAARKMGADGKTFADAVKSGAIPRGANPYFIAGFREQFGRVSADKFKSDMIASMGQNDKLQASTNVADFDQFSQQYEKDWITQNVDPGNRDPYFERGFGFRSDAYLSQLREEFARGVAQRVEKFSGDTHFAEITNHILDGVSRGVPDDQIAASIDTLNTEAVQNQGRDGTVVNAITAQAVVSAALRFAEQGDSRALSVLDLLKKTHGNGGTLDRTQYGSAAYVKALDDVHDALYKANERERQQAQDTRDDVTRTTVSQAVQALAANPNANLKPFAEKLATQGNPAAAADLTTLANNVGALTYKTDEATKNDFFSRIWQDGNVVPSDIVHAMVQQHSLTAQDSSWLISQIEMQKTAKSDVGNRVFGDFQFQTTLANLRSSFADPITNIVPADKADKVRYAQAMLMQRWAQYTSADGAQATPQQRSDWLNSTADALIAYARGPEPLSIAPTSKPAMEGTDPMKSLVLTPGDLTRITGELRSGALSPYTLNLFKLWHLDTVDQRNAFLRAQAGLAKSSQTPAKAAP